MPEFIERDEAVRVAIEACVEVCKDITGHGITHIHGVEVAKNIENIPAADAVEVVRCKNCKKCVKKGDFMYCEEHSGGWGDNLIYVEEDDYCRHGERKCSNDNCGQALDWSDAE